MATEIKNSVTLTMSYNGTDTTRKYKINEVPTSAISQIQTKTEAVNASLAGGTDGGLSTTFVTDDYTGSGTNGTLAKVSEVKIVTEEITDIDLS